ncbi:unnamed protein product [Caenorhabditis nigoni]
MKSFVFFLLAICHVAADGVIANKEEYLKELNEERRIYAKKARIPNMYKLFWDDYLKETVRTKSHNCDGETCRIVYRTPDAEAYRHAQEMVKYLFGDDKRPELIKDYKTHHMNGNEDFTPGQKKIGCVARKTIQNKLKGYGDFIYNSYCLMAPEGDGESWNVPRGEPGSACGQGFENDDGLCSPVQKAQSSARGGAGSSSSENSTLITDGASYAEVGTVILLFVVSMIL